MRLLLSSFSAASVLIFFMGGAYLFAAGNQNFVRNGGAAIDSGPSIFSGVAPCEACESIQTLLNAYVESDDPAHKKAVERFSHWRNVCARERQCGTENHETTIQLASLPMCGVRSESHISVFGRIGRLSSLIAQRAESCRSMSCPMIDCNARAKLRAELGYVAEALEILGGKGEDVVRDEFGSDVDNTGLLAAFTNEVEEHTGAIETQLSDLASLPEGPTQRSRALATISASLNARYQRLVRIADQFNAEIENLDDGVITPGNDGALSTIQEGIWRFRTLSFGLAEVEEAVGNLRRRSGGSNGVLVSSADSSIAVSDLAEAWEEVAEAVGKVLLYTARLKTVTGLVPPTTEANLESGTGSANCADTERYDALAAAGHVDHAISMLDFCGSKTGCPAGDEEVEIGKLTTADESGLTEQATASKVLDTFVEKLEQQAMLLTPSEGPPVSLKPDLKTYASREAISVAIGQNKNQCVSDGGAWVGIFPNMEMGGDLPAEIVATNRRLAESMPPIRSRDLRSSDQESIRLEAPSQPGNYLVKVFAGDHRGGAVLGSEEITVENGTNSCKGFSGEWQLGMAPSSVEQKDASLRLEERDGRVRGTYRKVQGTKAGFVIGKVRRNTMTGIWATEFATGGLRLTLSKDGKKMTGSSGWAERQYKGAEKWEATCVE